MSLISGCVHIDWSSGLWLPFPALSYAVYVSLYRFFVPECQGSVVITECYFSRQLLIYELACSFKNLLVCTWSSLYSKASLALLLSVTPWGPSWKFHGFSLSTLDGWCELWYLFNSQLPSAFFPGSFFPQQVLIANVTKDWPLHSQPHAQPNTQRDPMPFSVAPSLTSSLLSRFRIE